MDRLSLITVKDELIKRGVYIFSVRDFIRIFKVLPKTARAFLSYHSKDGVFTRLKMGVYVLSGNPPTKFELANYIYKPSYISFESALSYYGIIPETVYSVTSATTKSTKDFNLLNQNYEYRKIKRKLFFGYTPIKVRNKVILIADKEKALLDYLYLLSLKGKSFNERIDLSKIDKKKLGQYVNYFKRSVRKINALISMIERLNI